jgi:hypothetical protein
MLMLAQHVLGWGIVVAVPEAIVALVVALTAVGLTAVIISVLCKKIYHVTKRREQRCQ